ncbi:VOC family protein [Salipiger sp. 1_MG-2023]|uniref:VOC family protein n=1 Tax=Salipiger sp. 1_MG-2023 TaxID=3062665 RepID=UPI0026E2EABC|nr:VOC family protein [Salipiger sp. 1_MG-2023]MDO6586516.1 VOC family protein [Salipiger sp. 1_MG-2023]
MPFSTYLFFDGTCREAMSRYAQILNLPAPQFLSLSDLPPDEQAKMPGLPADAVMNCMISFEDSVIMGSDDAEAGPMAGCSLTLTLPDADEAKRVFEALAEGGEVRMALEPTFWSPAFGTLTDRYGIRWMIMAAMQP